VPNIPAPIAPLSRTGGYYAKAWWRFVRPSRAGIPKVRPTASLAGHALLDEVLLSGFRAINRDAASLAPRVTEEVNAAAEVFGAHGWLDAPETYHLSPPPLEQDDVRVRRVRGVRQVFEVVSFESGYQPHAAEPGRDRWIAYEGNAVVRAWMLRHDAPRPWLICVHGARMGTPNIDLSLFHAEWLHRELGLNVLLPVQPLHGRRRRGAPKGTTYPAGDLLDNVHGAAQAVWDVRRALTWIRSQDPGARVGLTGVSLGGYVGSMVASLEPDLACAILGVPVVDLIDLMEDHAPADAGADLRPLLEPARRVSRVVSPLAMRPAIPHERRYLYAGLADRVVHPTRQVMRLYEHWGRPEVLWYRGGHVLFFRAGVQPFVRDALARSGLLDVDLALSAREEG
jgi:hypothetical protein